MKRKIIQIDEQKCNGCGLCTSACHEGAIELINGKATLIRDDYCDGLGDCLPACPTNAITFTEREAPDYDPLAVSLHKVSQASVCSSEKNICPSAAYQGVLHSHDSSLSSAQKTENDFGPSALRQWPVQIKLAPIQAPYYENASLLIAADCTAYARADFHARFMQKHVTLIGCPKLDAVDYAEKLTAILQKNTIKKITVVRMEVPCCGGIEYAVQSALKASKKMIPWQVITLSTQGEILYD